MAEDIDLLKDDFSEENFELLEEYENTLSELFITSQYKAFIDMWWKIKDFCGSNGPGGVAYFADTWGNDPRIVRARNTVYLQGKYREGVSSEDVCEEVVDFLRGSGAVQAKDVFKQLQFFTHDQVQDALSELCKSKTIRKEHIKDKGNFYTLI